MSPITTHVLDTALGKPAAGISVTLIKAESDGKHTEIASGFTDADGRISDLLSHDASVSGIYRIVFKIEEYFQATGRDSFYPRVEVEFRVEAGGGHYHVPLLLSPFGYSTYRGS